MTTKLIGIREFRSKMAEYVRKAQKGDVRYIVMNRNQPFFEVRPLTPMGDDEGEYTEEFINEIEEARKSVAEGKFSTLDEVEERLSL